MERIGQVGSVAYLTNVRKIEMINEKGASIRMESMLPTLRHLIYVNLYRTKIHNMDSIGDL